MPCVKKSTLSSALTAATATLSSIYSGSVPASSPAAVQTSVVPAVVTSSSAVASGIAAQATGASSGASSTVPTATGNQTTYAGINIAGFDFGCSTDGTCTVVTMFPVSTLGSVIDNSVADMVLSLVRTASRSPAPARRRCSTLRRMTG